jgi:Zn-dependent metalloprotease
MGHKTYGAVLVAVAALAAGQLTGWSNAAPARPSATAVAQDRLVGDATHGLRLSRGADGVTDFAGVAAGEEIANPSVTPGTSVRAAADAHLSRYGAAFGLTRAGTSLTYAGRAATPSHQDLVRYEQEVDGVPVLGGQVVVALRPDRQLGSVLTTITDAAAVPAASVAETDAVATARAAVTRRTGLDLADVPAASQGRWVWDPAVVGSPSADGPRGVWRLEVGDGESALHTVLVDDRTGGVLLDIDDLQSALDRVVCNNNNTRAADTSCTGSFARTEGGPASGVTDVNQAYDHAGEVATFYDDVAGVDLTQLLGVNVGGQPKLAATVRYCRFTGGCPMANAFWNGAQMFYGAGYAGADDVVGHEMTHGVIDHSSDLLYWGQSGALNESLADIMGEIVDRRNTLDGTDATWPLGEDIPGGALRSLSNPSAFGQPDRMTSGFWDADTFGYGDNGGVHTNRGVGNKTAYLIAQGGTINGQPITGIDGGDTTLSKTAALYYDVIQRLTSGSDYANLADVLEQTCADFVDQANLHGFNSGDCTNVAKVVTATELRTTPTNAPQPADAPQTCPTGSYRKLFDSEVGNPSAAFTAGGHWQRLVDPASGGNATSGHDSWFADDPASTTVSALTLATPLTLPAGQPTYLWFQQWRLYGYSGGNFYDGGTVELDSTADAYSAYRGEDFAWVNGPAQNLAGAHSGRKGFGSDSFGWVASRVDLSAFGGSPVRPTFTSRTQVGALGWWLDDIVIYTCDGGTVTAPPLPSPPTSTPTPTPNPTSGPTSAPTTAPVSPAAAGVAVRGGLGKAVVTWQTPTSGASAVSAYRVFTTGISTNLPAGARTTTLTGLKQGTTYPVTVVPIVAAGQPGTPVTVKLVGTKTSLVVRQAGAKTKLTGKLTGASGVVGAALKLYVKKGSKWVKVATTRTGKGGAFLVKVPGTQRRTFRAVYAGGAGLLGNRSPQRHR